MAHQRTYYVYIMGSKSRVIYVGMTGFLMARVLRHRAGEGGEFTRRYLVHRLVYFSSFRNVGDAIARETEIKKWRRGKKVALIEERNPTWEDLAEGWGEAAVMRVSGAVAGSKCFYVAIASAVVVVEAESRFLTGTERRFGMTKLLVRCGVVGSMVAAAYSRFLLSRCARASE